MSITVFLVKLNEKWELGLLLHKQREHLHKLIMKRQRLRLWQQQCAIVSWFFHVGFNRKSPCYIPHCGGAVLYSMSGIHKTWRELRGYLKASAILFSVGSSREIMQALESQKVRRRITSSLGETESMGGQKYWFYTSLVSLHEKIKWIFTDSEQASECPGSSWDYYQASSYGFNFGLVQLRSSGFSHLIILKQLVHIFPLLPYPTKQHVCKVLVTLVILPIRTVQPKYLP